MANKKENITTEKANGRVYTPDYIVKNILDLAGYYEENILKKHVIDNSCGDGAFLVEIVDRYCKQSLKLGVDKLSIANELGEYIHGIEIDKEEHKKCLSNVDAVIKKYNIKNVSWDILCDNTLNVHKYDNKMDFVLGNPPYIRVHNLGDSFDNIKKYTFAQNGMTDLYIVFYEIGLKMLNKNGVLGYITPSSFFNSVAGNYMREIFVKNNYLAKVVDLKHFQAFNAMTYTTIVILKKFKEDNTIKYYEFDEKNLIPFYVETLTTDDFYISKNFYFSNKQNLKMLKKIFFNLGHCDVFVKNGFATLCDNVFINKFNFNSQYIIPVIKASKGIKKSIIYPYDKNANLISEDILKQDQELYSYLQLHKDKLLKRSNENKNQWYAFGRSQAINDTFSDKLAINSLIKTTKDIKLTNAPSGTGVYSGLYLMSKTIPIEKIKETILSQEFVDYVSLLSKYKSGGYYTFSSKDLKAYLDYKLAYYGGLFEWWQMKNF